MKSIWKLWRLIIFLVIVQSPAGLQAQTVLLDEPVKAGELTLFPELDHPNQYRFLLDKVRLGIKENGSPEFSFVRYVEKKRPEPGTGDVEGDGEGILHTLFEFYIPDDIIREAERALRRINSNGTIVGPVLYESGVVKVVSGLTNQQGDYILEVVGMGNAPLMQGHRAAFSAQLSKKGTKILWESMHSATPLLAFSFEMEISGYRSPKRVKIEADFNQIYEHRFFDMATVTPVFAGEIQSAFEDLRQSGAIKVVQIGADEKLEKALDAAYEKLTRLIFEPAGNGAGIQMPDQTGGRKSMLDRATDMLNKARDEARKDMQIEKSLFDNDQDYESFMGMVDEEENRMKAWRKKNGDSVLDDRQRKTKPDKIELPALAAGFSYRLKEERKSGHYTIDLNKYLSAQKIFPFSVNLDPPRCAACFVELYLDDDSFYKQREIKVAIEGVNSDDFENYINSVTVMLRKKHRNGAMTEEEINIDKPKFNQDANQFRMIYGNKGDGNGNAWLEYEYKVMWSFYGGHLVEADWQKANTKTINLVPPLRKKRIDLEVDPEFVTKQQIRVIELNLIYTLQDKEYVKEVRLDLRRNEGYSQTIDILFPPGTGEYAYEVTFYTKGGNPIEVKRRKTKDTFLYLKDFL